MVWRVQEIWLDVVTRLVGLGALTGRPFALTGARVPAASALRCSRWTCIHECRLAQVCYARISPRLHPSQTTLCSAILSLGEWRSITPPYFVCGKRTYFHLLGNRHGCGVLYIECLKCILHASPIFGVCLFV